MTVKCAGLSPLMFVFKLPKLFFLVPLAPCARHPMFCGNHVNTYWLLFPYNPYLIISDDELQSMPNGVNLSKKQNTMKGK